MAKMIFRMLLGAVALGVIAYAVFLLKQNDELTQALKEKEFQAEVVAEDNQKLTAENEALKREIATKKELQDNFSAIKADLDARLKASEDKSGKLEADLKDTSWKLEQLKSENSALTEENTSLASKVKRLESELKDASGKSN